MFTGIGGQGIQLISKTLAGAAVAEGREAMLLGHYGFSMRGGQTDASLVVGDAPLRALPILPSAWSALVMASDYWHDTRERIRPGGVIVASVALEGDLARPDCQTFVVAASTIAADMGAPLSAGYILLGAYASITELVGLDSLLDSMRQLVPPYRAQHIAVNEQALRAGYEAVERGAAPAWGTVPVSSGGLR